MEEISEEVKGISHKINRTIEEMLPDGFRHTCIITDGEQHVLLATNMSPNEVLGALSSLASHLAGPPGAVEFEKTPPGLGPIAPGGSA